MKVNHLLHEIIRHDWLIDPLTLQSYKPLVAKILAGETSADIFSDNDDKPQAIDFVDQNGRRVNIEQIDPNGEQELVAIVNMIGPIIKYGDLCTWGADEIVSQLYMANNMEAVKGIILNIDGPGGSVSAIGPFIQFSKVKQKPVVALCDMTCSCHYWAAVQVADHIMADNDVSALFGSVGVVSSFIDEKPYWEEKGIKFHEIYPDESEHKNEAYRLALKGNYDLIKKEHLKPIALKFQNAVKAGRPNLVEATGVLTGKTFAADQALELNMIDSIGSMQEALTTVLMLNEFNQVNSIIN